jgi:Nif-specific regulatory protein
MASINAYKLDQALAQARKAVELLKDAPDVDRASTLYLLSLVEFRLNRRESLATNAAALQLARLSAAHYLEVAILSGRTFMFEAFGQFDEMERTAGELYALGRSQKAGLAQVRSLTESARCDLTMGRYDRAVARAELGKEIATYAAQPTSLAANALFSAEALFFGGRQREAIASLEAVPRDILERGPREWADYPALLLLQLRVQLGTQPPAVDDDAREALDRLNAASPALALAAVQLRLIIAQHASDNDAHKAGLASYDELWKQSGLSLGPLNRLTTGVHAAQSALALGDPARALSYCTDPFQDRLEGPAPFARAQLRFLAAKALESTDRAADARAVRIDGGRLLTEAVARIEDADFKRDFAEQSAVRAMLGEVPRTPDANRIDALYEMIRVLNSESDPEVLLGQIIEMAMKAVDAERGMILLAGPSGTDFSVRLARNLEKETSEDAEAFSRRIVAEAGAGKPILALDAGQDDRFKDFRSVSLYKIRSLMCAPLRSRGRVIGTVYLDSRRQGRPFTQEDLRFVEAFSDHAALALENATRRAELESENRRLRAIVGERSSYGEILGRSPAMQRTFELLERVAQSDVTILIQGESGTGKELVAKALHFHGPRKEKAFLSENCAALPETLLESELFGHVKGAFTGAERDRAGLFEQAHDGTLFLDEIGDTSPAMQARLLRVLQEGELRRVGGDHTIKVNVRVIAATNKDLSTEMAAGRFREDLYYRLAVVPVSLPPLRERVGDIPYLAGQLLERIASARGRPTPRIDADVLDAFERYPWPGNVRQLENLLRRIVLLAGDAPISRAVLEADADLSRLFLGKQTSFVPVMSIAKGEEDQIRRALEAAAGHRDRAARLLGISRATIYRKLREYNIT